jgi:hypothetical protein
VTGPSAAPGPEGLPAPPGTVSKAPAPAAPESHDLVPRRPEFSSVTQVRLDAWAFVRIHFKFTILCCLTAAALIAADVGLFFKRAEYEREVARLRHGMTGVERQKADYVFAANKDKLRVMVELIRRQAGGDRDLHLSVAVDRGEMYLEREGVRLRQMPIAVGPEQMVGGPSSQVPVASPRGARTVTAVAPWALSLSGGMMIYADSADEHKADSAGPTPGNVRLQARDFAAILPDVKPGMTVYFY